tara:strand:+ start:1004 stop:1357 length:354 start_codon:yes stop_codon:yes gene_type:complete
MDDQLSLIIIKGSQSKVLDTINKAFGLNSQKKTIKLNKKEKRNYNHKKNLTSVQRKLLSIYVSENDNFTWSQLFDIFNTTNIARPSNRLVHHFLKQNDCTRIKTIHNQKIKYVWKKK